MTDDPLNLEELLEGLGVKVYAVPIESPEHYAHVMGDLLGIPGDTAGEKISNIAAELYSRTAMYTRDLYMGMQQLAELAEHIQTQHAEDENYDLFRQMFPNQLVFTRAMLSALEMNRMFLEGIRGVPGDEQDEERRQANLHDVNEKIHQLQQQIRRATCAHRMVEHDVSFTQTSWGMPGTCRQCDTAVAWEKQQNGYGQWVPAPAERETQ